MPIDLARLDRLSGDTLKRAVIRAYEAGVLVVEEIAAEFSISLPLARKIIAEHRAAERDERKEVACG